MKTILQSKHPLNAAGIDKISEEIAQTLTAYPNLTKRDILRLRLSTEEILLHWQQEAGQSEVELVIEEKSRWVDLTLLLNGIPYRLTPPDSADTDGINGMDGMLANLGLDWIYQFDQGRNSAYISVEAKECHRVSHVLIAMALALVTSAVLRLAGGGIADTVHSSFVQPILNLCARVLTAVVSPMMLFAVINGVLSVGSPRSFNQVGRLACVRYLFSMLATILCAGIICVLCFSFSFTGFSIKQLFGFSQFIAGIVPDNALSPLIEGNMLQIVFIGFLVGLAMLFLQRRVNLSARLVGEASAIVLKLLYGFEKMMPAFIFLSFLSMGLSADVSTLLRYGRTILLFVSFIIGATAVQFWYVSRRTGISAKRLWQILRPTFMAQLSSACSSSAFSDAYDACEKGFGIDKKLVRFALPIGTVIHKPLIAAEFVFLLFAIRDTEGLGMDFGSLLVLLLMAYMMSVAYPPVSGGEISCYTVLLHQLGMSSGLLAAACSLSALFDILEAPCNTLCTELQLLLTAHKNGLLRGGKVAESAANISNQH